VLRSVLFSCLQKEVESLDGKLSVAEQLTRPLLEGLTAHFDSISGDENEVVAARKNPPDSPSSKQWTTKP
jgi:hypothetical protein